MYEYTENKTNALELANQCLAMSGEPIEPLLIYIFQDDVEAHDDELQDRLEAELNQHWLSATEELSKVFGPAYLRPGDGETDSTHLRA